MGKFFNLDSPFVQFMNRVADLMWLNIIFVICCIPVVTIGASVTAMYYVTLKMVRDEETYITKSFFKSFKQNFFQATVIWMIALSFGAVFVADYLILKGSLFETIGSGTFASVLQILIIAVFVFYLFTLSFVFPVLSKFDNTIKNTIKNSFLMSIRHFPTALVCILVAVVVVVLTYFISIMTLFSFILTFSVSFYGCSFLFVKVFDNYIPKKEEELEMVTEDEAVADNNEAAVEE